jgi:hypothetical protein
VRKKVKRSKKLDKFSIWLLILQIPLLSFSVFRFFSPTLGWFSVLGEKMASGELYRTTFSPLPPLSIFLEGYIPTRFNQPLVADSIINSLFWLLFVYLLNECSRTLTNPRISFYVVLTFSYMYFSEPTDIVSGYFELVWIFICFTYIWSVKTIKNPTVKNVAITSIFSMSLVLIKQNFLIVSLVCLIVVGYNLYKKSLKNFYSLIVIASLPYATAAVILFIYSSTIFKQLNGASKNPSLNFLTDNLFNWPIKTVGYASLTFFIACAMSISFNKTFHKIAITKILFLSGAVNALFNFMDRQGVANISSQLLLNLALINLEIIVIAFLFFIQPKKPSIKVSVLILIPLIGIALNTLLPALGLDSSKSLPTSNSLLTYFEGFKVLLSACLLAFMISILISIFSKELQNSYFYLIRKSPAPQNPKSPTELDCHLFILFISFSVAVANSLSGGLTIQSFSLMYCLVFSILLSRETKPGKNLLDRAFIGTATVTVLVLSLLQIHTVPYSWWGFKIDSLSKQSSSLADIGLPLFKATSAQKDFFAKVQQTVSSEENKESSIYFGPNIQGLKYVFDSLPTYEGRCIIIWWDVCPEELALEDLKNLKKDLPKYVLWNHFPSYVAQMHERSFRSGQDVSAVNQLDRWVTEQSLLGQYRVIATWSINEESQGQNWELVFLAKSEE